MKEKLYKVFNNDTAGGILLIMATLLAMIIVNIPLLSPFYDKLITMPIEIRVGDFELAKPLLLWVNDGLMAIFFLAVGLELKHEMIEGHLSDRRNMILPLMGALGGMVIPALLYTLFNYGDPIGMNGWAIPMATDIAFALGILMLLGKRVPTALKVLLVSMAIFDDIGAIVVIALFYTDELSLTAMLFALGFITVLWMMNRRGVTSVPSYVLVGLFLWIAVLKSGVHATLAGIVLALFIPYKSKDGKRSIAKDFEHDLDGSITYMILPLFAFANAGILLHDVSMEAILHPIPLGVTLGLFLGKQLGVFSFCWITVRLGLAKLPQDVNWKLVYGISLLAGIGFTMSLFIASLSFENSGTNLLFDERLGIILGSLLSGIAGYLVLKRSLNTKV